VADLSISEFADVDSAARAIVREGFRTLAMKHHPDKGGTHATMAMLTETKHQLMKMLDLIKD
jgi:DnaJ-class molecular chaperone